MARAFLEDGLAAWFANHLATMDAALAAHLKTRQGGAEADRGEDD